MQISRASCAIGCSVLLTAALAIRLNRAMELPHLASPSPKTSAVVTVVTVPNREIPPEQSVRPQITDDAVCAKSEPEWNNKGSSTEAPKPGGIQGSKKASEIKVDPLVVAKLEKVLGAAPRNCVIIANLDGEILKSFRLKDSTLEKYSTFEKYVTALSKESDPKPCKKVSETCVLCPDGKIYCTNAVKYKQKASEIY